MKAENEMHRKYGRLRGLLSRALDGLCQFIIDTQRSGFDLWRGYR